MSPSRIQTAAVVLRQRRSPHLERPKKARLFELMRGPQMLHVRRREPRTLLFTTLATAQALFNWVVMG